MSVIFSLNNNQNNNQNIYLESSRVLPKRVHGTRRLHKTQTHNIAIEGKQHMGSLFPITKKHTHTPHTCPFQKKNKKKVIKPISEKKKNNLFGLSGFLTLNTVRIK